MIAVLCARYFCTLSEGMQYVSFEGCEGAAVFFPALIFMKTGVKQVESIYDEHP